MFRKEGDFIMTSQQIEYVLAVSRYHSFSETARRLYISQPSISKQIAALENELGVKLFERTKKGPTNLTKEGKIMLKAFEKMHIIFENAKKDVLQINDSASTNIHIAFLQGLDISSQVNASVDLLKQQYPNINIIAECLNPKQLNLALRRNEIDLAISLKYEIVDDKLLNFTPLYQLNQAITVRKNHPLSQKKDLDYNLLRQQTFFASEGSRGFKQYFEFLNCHFGIQGDNIVMVKDVETLFINVESGLGVALLCDLPRNKTNKDMRLFLVNDLPKVDFYAAWRYDNRSTIRNSFIDILKEDLSSRLAEC